MPRTSIQIAGIQIDAALVAVGALLTAGLTIAGATLFSWLAVRGQSRRRPERPTWLAHLGFVRPLTVGIGARLALDGGGRNGRAASRPALVGAAAAVAGLVAIITLNNGLNESLSHPEVAGVTWDATVYPLPSDISDSGVVNQSVVDSVRLQPGVDALTTVSRGVVELGEVGVPTYGLVDDIDDEDGSPLQLVTLSGRRPEQAGEVDLGPSTAHDLGVDIGGTVTGPHGRVLHVVGIGLFPSDVHAQFDEGAWVLPADWLELAGGTIDPEHVELFVAVRFSDRHDIAGQTTALGDSLGSSVQGSFPADRPDELNNLHSVRALPTALAMFLTLLGVLAVGHALFSSVRRRRKDFAILRALGVTSGGARVILAAHGTVVALTGLAVGVPIGFVAGRIGWRAITDRVPLAFRSPLTTGALILVVPVAILTANALAIIPGRRAARVRPAVILRSE